MNILFVDDEKMILNSLKRGLRGLKYNLYFADSGQKALDFMEVNEIDIIFSDMRMPGMSGLDLLKIIDEKYPDTLKIILSGYAQLPQLIATINQSSIFRYIAKPWDLHKELIPTIHECVDYVNFKKSEKLKIERTENLNNVYKNIFKTYNNKSNAKDQSYDVIRIYQHLYTKVLLRMTEDFDTSVVEKHHAIKSFKAFLDLLLDEMKEKKMYFETRRIVQEVTTILKSNLKQLTFDTEHVEYKDHLLVGRGQYLKPLLIMLLSDILPKNPVGTVRLNIIEELLDNNTCMVSYGFIASKRLFDNYKSIKYSLLLYRSIASIFGGDLKIRVTDSEVNIQVKGLLHIDAEEEDNVENSNSR